MHILHTLLAPEIKDTFLYKVIVFTKHLKVNSELKTGKFIRSEFDVCAKLRVYYKSAQQRIHVFAMDTHASARGMFNLYSAKHLAEEKEL